MDSERLERVIQQDIVQAIEDGFNGHDVNRDKILNDVKWLIEQAEKVEQLEKSNDRLKEIIVSRSIEDAFDEDETQNVQ